MLYFFTNFKPINSEDNNSDNINSNASNFGFSWNDGSAVDFTLWGPVVPSPPKDNRDCVYMSYSNYSDRGWRDGMCDSPYSRRKFVCEAKPTENVEIHDEGNFVYIY